MLKGHFVKVFLVAIGQETISGFYGEQSFNVTSGLLSGQYQRDFSRHFQRHKNRPLFP